MKLKEFFKIALPKWSAMVVKGEDVSGEQAGEIIIRTDRFWFSTNDKEFMRELYKVLGAELVKDGCYPDFKKLEKVQKKYLLT